MKAESHRCSKQGLTNVYLLIPFVKEVNFTSSFLVYELKIGF